MKKIIILSLTASLLLNTGCDSVNINNTQGGAAAGAVLGAVLGGVIGNNVKGGDTATGAVIGGVLGGLAGGILGNKMDKQAREIQQSIPGAEVAVTEGGIFIVLGENSINFDVAKSTLTPAAKVNLDKLVKTFKDYPDTNLGIYGHTDSRGKLDFNMKLAQDRANSVKAYLVSQGVAENRFYTKGIGPAEPIADNETAEGRAKNRRVEFTIKANQKMINDAKKEAGE
jgi:outer membrane protein OmpA-like peptidoglycan-associated protein